MADFVAGTTLTAAALNAALENYQPVNAQTGTTYTFALTDAGGLVTAANTSPQTYTVPPNSSVAFDAAVRIDLLNISTGLVIIAPGSGVTVNGGLIVPPDSRARLIKTATNTWYAQVTPHTAGEVLLATATPAAASTVSFADVFVTAFTKYRIEWDLATASGTQNLQLRMRLAGTDDSSANYHWNSFGPAGTVTASPDSLIACGVVQTVGGLGNLEVWNPRQAVPTRMQGQFTAGLTSITYAITAATHNVSTAYDGFTLYPAGSTVTGVVRVYGVATSL